MDGRRHSVDVPISRTLVALRRVRSLRDPSTHSMSKLSSLIDTFDWETNPDNTFTIGFDGMGDHELYYSSRHRNSEMVDENNTMMEKYHDDYDGKSSNDEQDEFLNQNEENENNFVGSRHSKLGNSYKVKDGDASSRSGSPFLYSIGETQTVEPIGFMGYCHQGCGISSCWSRTKKYRETNLVNNDDVLEEQPLLSTEEIPFLESPRNFCQKFSPKSFADLVGQDTVATSLLNAISNKQIRSFYLFHGPRGTGKTSASKIFAAALNCLSPSVSNEPCGSCWECGSVFSGRSWDFHELDPPRIYKIGRHELLDGTVRASPVSSRFKVYVVDECHLLRDEMWAGLLGRPGGPPKNVIFVMLTTNLDKVPGRVVSRSSVHRFQSVNESDIVGRLRKICGWEGINFDEDALSFIAKKSSGSVRDAEMMLDQLSLVGRQITVSLVYEVNGVVSNDELLDLLCLALSSDASSTVKRARELMRSRTEPLQLMSQLANLIMDILAGKFPDGVSDAAWKLFGMDNSEANMHQLSHALKILSQTEKQLRTSKNQTTWLIAALLQLCSAHDMADARLSMRMVNPPEDETEQIRTNDNEETLESVWSRAVGICRPHAFRKFLRKRGKVVDIRLMHGTAIAELQFNSPYYISKAEQSWKEIAGALQLILGYNVELRINLSNNDTTKNPKFKGPYLGLFFCSQRVHLKKSISSINCKSNDKNNTSENSDSTLTKLMKDKCIETCSSEFGLGKELFKTIRSKDGNALSIGMSTPCMARDDHKGCLNSARIETESKPGRKENLKFRCWKNAMFAFRKAWQPKHLPRDDGLVEYAMHCETAT